MQRKLFFFSLLWSIKAWQLLWIWERRKFLITSPNTPKRSPNDVAANGITQILVVIFRYFSHFYMHQVFNVNVACFHWIYLMFSSLYHCQISEHVYFYTKNEKWNWLQFHYFVVRLFFLCSWTPAVSCQRSSLVRPWPSLSSFLWRGGGDAAPGGSCPRHSF